MTLRRNDDGKYPVSLQEFKLSFPTISFSNQPDFEAFGHSVVFDSPIPDYNLITEVLVELAPVKVKGKWYRVWSVVKKDEGLVDEGLRSAQLAEHAGHTRALIANYRYNAETGGLIFRGHVFATDREAQANVALQWTNIQLDPTSRIDWKTAIGEWIELDHDGLKELATAVSMFVQACRSHERALCKRVTEAKDLDDLSAVMKDSILSWPSNEF